MARIADMGGAVAAIEAAYMKQRLVESNLKRLAAIEAGEQTVVGVNAYTDAEPSPLSTGEGAILTVDAAVERGQIERLQAWRAARDSAAVKKALDELAAAAKEDRNIMPASIACAQAGVTTGEWAETLRAVFGEYRAPTGVARAVGVSDGRLEAARREVDTVSRRLGRRIKILVGKPGLDGHSNGAEQIAVRARDCGMEVVYEGIRLTPERIVNAALEESVHVVGLSILSGGHVSLVARGAGRPARRRHRRRAGGGRRHHPAGRRRGADQGAAWPASTRPRTSTSPRSCATSSPSWTARGRKRLSLCWERATHVARAPA